MILFQGRSKKLRITLFNYRPQRSWGKVMFLEASVILLTGGSTSPPLGADIPPPSTHTPPPPGADTPPGLSAHPRD